MKETEAPNWNPQKGIPGDIFDAYMWAMEAWSM